MSSVIFRMIYTMQIQKAKMINQKIGKACKDNIMEEELEGNS